MERSQLPEKVRSATDRIKAARDELEGAAACLRVAVAHVAEVARLLGVRPLGSDSVSNALGQVSVAIAQLEIMERQTAMVGAALRAPRRARKRGR